MTAPTGDSANDRRYGERRVNQRLVDITVPELRKNVTTALLFAIVVLLFLYMVRRVLIGAILALIVGVYIRPLYKRLLARLGSPPAAAVVTLALVVVPVVALVVYSYVEIRGVAVYVAEHEREIAQRIGAALREVPLVGARFDMEVVRGWVLRASNYGIELPGLLRDAIVEFAVSTTVFLFTAFYVLTDAERIAAFIDSKIPPRYSQLEQALERNVRGVLYGAIYATLLTQTIKSAIIFGLNLLFQVPLAAVLAILSFVIGFFPIVGSWAVYVPVAIWLWIFRGDAVGAVTMLTAGFVVNTILISTYLRPKLAAEKSQVLNFYWMFVGLVTGVYTFGIVGILIGPIVIGVLKAIVDTISAPETWRTATAEPTPAGDAPSGGLA